MNKRKKQKREQTLRARLANLTEDVAVAQEDNKPSAVRLLRQERAGVQRELDRLTGV